MDLPYVLRRDERGNGEEEEQAGYVHGIRLEFGRRAALTYAVNWMAVDIARCCRRGVAIAAAWVVSGGEWVREGGRGRESEKRMREGDEDESSRGGLDLGRLAAECWGRCATIGQQGPARAF